jgi:phosphoribosyl-AMP cyclohydrolase / phosphoribosyl-ATP pyrophosphohydrolase
VEISRVKWDEQGLVPAIIQDARTKQVLTLAYMNKISLQKTIDTGETWLYSRSRQELWHKGATSGNTQQVISLTYDCDQDAILLQVIPAGPACHTGSTSCFPNTEVEKQSPDGSILIDLEALISNRYRKRPEGSYTTYLFNNGVDKIGKKIGEEAAEVIIAAKNSSHDELRYEAADLIYHLMVLMQNQGLPFAEVLTELEKRFIGRKN